jgi:hypothetical protein
VLKLSPGLLSSFAAVNDDRDQSSELCNLIFVKNDISASPFDFSTPIDPPFEEEETESDRTLSVAALKEIARFSTLSNGKTSRSRSNGAPRGRLVCLLLDLL